MDISSKRSLAVVFSIALFVMLTAPDTIGSEKSKTISAPQALLSAIQKTYPGSSIVGHNDPHDKDCGNQANEKWPSFIAADFNGDKIQDYAALLIHDKPKKQTEHGPLHDFTVAAFLGTPVKEFRAFKLWSTNKHPQRSGCFFRITMKKFMTL